MKIISKPIECGWRKQTFTRLGLPSGIYICWHKSKVIGEMICDKPIDFPKNCPLQDGMPIGKFKDRPDPKNVNPYDSKAYKRTKKT